MTPLKNLKKWRVIQANTLWWLSLSQNRGRGSFLIASRIYLYHPYYKIVLRAFLEGFYTNIPQQLGVLYQVFSAIKKTLG